ncbi:MAG: DNA polymerase III subunit alpha [bacterium]
MNEFVHLHLHSHYSLLDGAIKIGDIINKAIEFDMPSVAVTDHGNMFGAIEFYEKAVKKGVKPIIGCEMYVSKSDMKLKNANEKYYYHLILLAKNEEGYQNLSKLVSKSYLEGFYYKPRIDKNILKDNHKGLIALSACIKGEIPYNIVQGKYDAAEESLKYYLDLFKDDFYLEMQVQGMKEQLAANKGLLELSKKYGVPLVATNDCHYLLKDDYEAHDVLLCIQTGKTVEDNDRMKFSTKDLYFRSQEEMKEIFSEYPPEVISNTKVIAEKCNFSFKLKGEYRFPQFKEFKDREDNNSDDNCPRGSMPPACCASNHSVSDYFEQKAREGFEEVFIKNPTKAAAGSYLNAPETYKKRLDMEIEVIKKSNFAGYFLIVSDFIKYAKEHNIPVGPGRGSAAGSLAAYCLKITEIDPIKYDLMFERFLNPERISMPDIDSDFCVNGRDEVIRYVSSKYGEEQVSQIITFGTMLAKAVIRDTGRALNMPYAEVDKIAKLVPGTLGITLEEAVKEEPKLRELIETNPKVKKLIEIAKRLEGLARHASTHAAGVVISNEPIHNHMPLYKGTKETDVITTQYTGTDLEKLGFIKFDFLGLKTLTVMNEAIGLINGCPADACAQNTSRAGLPPGAGAAGSKFNIYDIDLDDRATFKLLSAGDTTGVFQLESSGMKELIKKLAPNSFEDLIPLVALYRPGPLGSGMVDDFIKAKHGRVKIHYIHPSLKDILKDTYGVILYQEQIMKIATTLAGFSMGEADVLRKGVGKKQAELINQMKDKFIAGCKSNGIDNTKSEKIFSLITKFGEYGFNKSHSTAYAYIAYMTAYLKANYKEHFTAALLSSEMTNTDKLSKIMNEAKSGANACEILPPSVNYSSERFTIVKTDGTGRLVIRTGLGAVKNVGKAAIDSILQTKGDKPFKDLLDFCSRVDTRKVNKRTIENLIKSGALDIGAESRKWMLGRLESIMEEAIIQKEKKSSGQVELFDSSSENFNYDSGKDDSYLTNSGEKDDKKSILAFEKESLGFYISGHPLDGYEEKIKLIGGKYVLDIVTEYINAKDKPKDLTYKMCGVINQLKIHKTKNNDKMASFILNDKNSNVEVVFFPKNYLKCENIIGTNQPVILTGKIDFSGLNMSGNRDKKGFELTDGAFSDENEDDGEDKRNNKAGPANFGYEIESDDIDMDIKVIGENIELLDSFHIKKPDKSKEVCFIEINEKASVFNADEFKNLLSEIKNILEGSKGESKVVLKTSGYSIALNGNFGVDKALLKSKNLPGYLNIL